jgi:putative serine protease PepD
MDRNQIDPSPDEEPPTSSGRSADERSLPPIDATNVPPAVASPLPPTASESDRPAGPDFGAPNPLRFEPAPLPPVATPPSTVSSTPPPPIPAPGPIAAARPAVSPTPPSAQLIHPPTAANPPRPGEGMPPTGPPNSSPPAFAGGPPPLGPKSRRWRVAAGVLAVILVAASLVSGGIVVGSALTDDVTVAVPTPAPVDPANAPAGDTGQSFPSQPVLPLVDEDSEEPVADVARAVSPSVVLISTNVGQGSGIVWDADNGYIVTNHHVIGDATSVLVQFPNGNQVSGTIVGGDPSRDIAVVQVEPSEESLVAAQFAPTSSVEVGQLAVAIGSPFGLDQSVTAGIVSAVNRINEFGGSDPANPVPVEMIQTDAPINPGNSGGALADREGFVIGMNTQIRTDGAGNGNIGVGFAVPSDTILLIAERIVAGESLELAHLGVSGETPTDGTVGALVTGVVEGAPAALAGIESGDLIVSLDRDLISTMQELSADVKLFRPDDVVTIEFVRAGERLQTSVRLGAN